MGERARVPAPSVKPGLSLVLRLPLKAAALDYAAKGVPVFPLIPNGKAPLTSHGFLDATTDPTQIKAWWTKWPDANIGAPTGLPQTFTVLDIDIKPWEGTRGDLSLADLLSRHGELPTSPEQRTWSEW